MGLRSGACAGDLGDAGSGNAGPGGIPTRAEITDAAMGQRAECIMLNKGPYILKALNYLDDILRRMATHQEKKRPQMRKLKLAGTFNLTIRPGQ